jgi:hypothetical protein
MDLSMGGRFLKIAVALTAIGGVVYAADQATAPPAPDLNRAIVEQMVNEGQSANAAPNAPADNKYTPEQMLVMAPKYAGDMQTAVEHAQDVRVEAYKSHDIIRMTCVDDKIGQMKTVINLAASPMFLLRTFKGQAIVMAEQFGIISHAHDRVTVLATEVDACMGDNLDTVTVGHIQEEQQPQDNSDWSRPPSPFQSVDRPPEASPYN